jgi:hypothetical protein
MKNLIRRLRYLEHHRKVQIALTLVILGAHVIERMGVSFLIPFVWVGADLLWLWIE